MVTYDPRGIERSTRDDPPSPMSPDQNVDDLHRVIQELDEGLVDVVASSGGAAAGRPTSQDN